jgi:hypothetical protein
MAIGTEMPGRKPVGGPAAQIFGTAGITRWRRPSPVTRFFNADCRDGGADAHRKCEQRFYTEAEALRNR